MRPSAAVRKLIGRNRNFELEHAQERSLLQAAEEHGFVHFDLPAQISVRIARSCAGALRAVTKAVRMRIDEPDGERSADGAEL